ncbi:PTS ascorbate transporter subunit IIC, partial [Escherichia coli]
NCVFYNTFGCWSEALNICLVILISEIFGSVWAVKVTGLCGWLGVAAWSIGAPPWVLGFFSIGFGGLAGGVVMGLAWWG